MKDHFCYIDGGFCKHLKIKLLGDFFDSKHTRVGLNKFIEGRDGTLKFKCLHDLSFFGLNCCDADFGMGNFVMNCLDSHRVDFFILRSDKHACDSGRVNVYDLYTLFEIVVEVVHEMN